MFLLIEVNYESISKNKQIQIHLMFLLIKNIMFAVAQFFIIQIHLMFLLIYKKTLRLYRYWTNSNTSHVLINPGWGQQAVRSVCDSNTSHVLINRIINIFSSFCNIIQIHLMFLLITIFGNKIQRPILFKYISCSY